MYEHYQALHGSAFIKRLDDDAFIPIDDDNSDYQVYLKWVEDGGITGGVE